MIKSDVIDQIVSRQSARDVHLQLNHLYNWALAKWQVATADELNVERLTQTCRRRQSFYYLFFCRLANGQESGYNSTPVPI